MKLHYLTQVNCKNVKAGTILAENEEKFEEEMIEKYSNNGGNYVQVLFK